VKQKQNSISSESSIDFLWETETNNKGGGIFSKTLKSLKTLKTLNPYVVLGDKARLGLRQSIFKGG